MLVNKNFRSKIHECFSPFFCSRDEKVSFSCHSHLSKSCFLVRCLLKGPINISIRPGFLTFCHLLLTTVRTPAYLQSRRIRWCCTVGNVGTKIQPAHSTSNSSKLRTLSDSNETYIKRFTLKNCFQNIFLYQF